MDSKSSFSPRRGVTPRVHSLISSLDHVDAGNDQVLSDQISFPKSDSVHFSDYLWDQSLSLANAVLETQFMHGIRHGSLQPENYGAYCVQDVAYCSNAVKDYDISIQNAKIPEVKEFLQQQRDGCQVYLKSSMKQWHIKDPEAIVLSEAVTRYIKFERMVAKFNNPVYLVVAMIPCSRLWYWMANQMLPYEGPTNVYSFWIRENRQVDVGKTLEEFVDKHSRSLDKDKALKVYQSAIICEGNFMRSACKQILDDLPAGLKETLTKTSEKPDEI